MATVATQLNSGTGFSSGETVTASKLNNLVNTATVTGIVNADIDAAADIAASKLAGTLDLSSKTITLPDSNIVTAKIADSAVTTAKINNAAVTAAKLDGAQTGSAPIYGCRAWVAFNATTGTTVGGEFRCTVRGSGNISKVVRTATGQFTVTFTTAMASGNYAVVANGSHASGVARGTNFEVFDTAEASFSMTAGYANTISNGTFYNPTWMHVAVFA